MPLLKATVRNSGLRVITAGSGTQALDLARADGRTWFCSTGPW